MILGLDAGNHAVKAVGPFGPLRFLSCLGEYRERRLQAVHGPDDMVWEYQGRRGFAGSLALHESEFAGSMMGDSKAHEDLQLRVLLALHRYGGDRYHLVVGQPISSHTPEEKERIRALLLGPHEITVNGERRHLVVEDVRVAAEGGAAFWSAPRRGLVRIIDIGAGTVNGATLVDGRYIDRDSWTLRYGRESTITRDPWAMARGIATEALKRWRPGDPVLLAGGAAEELVEPLGDYFDRLEILRPHLAGQPLHPVWANAVGFYAIAREVYGDA